MIRTSTYSFVLLGVAAVAFVAGSWRGPRDTVNAAGTVAHRVLYYHCPMHPAYTSETGGTAPCCGMALEPVYADGDQAGAAPSASTFPGDIRVDGGRLQLMGVRVGAVERSSGTEALRLFGRVVPEETRLYRLNVGLDGYIREISGVTTGSQVRKDQWLVSFSTPEARLPISGYLVTLDVLDREAKSAGTPAQMAPAIAAREQAIDRLLTLGMSPVQIEEIRRTRLAPPSFKVTSPVEGFVIARNVSAGQKIDKGDELFRIADLRRVWILADVPAGDAEHVRPGTVATVTLAGRTAAIHARVSSDVLPQFDPETQSSKIRLEADNPGFLLRPDMFVDVDLQLPYEAATLVPADAIVASGLRNTVFVERTAGVFEPRDVEIGRRIGDRTTIVRGVQPGERIAVSGTFLLDSESRMKAHDRPHH